ncbi:TPA: conjugal transfer protein TraD, partial [Escherichia coli]
LLSVSDLNDIEKITYIKAGRKFLAQMDGRQK